MSLARLKQRAPSAVYIECYTLYQHDLRFHKAGNDGSAKCNAYFTGDDDDKVVGALFTINQSDKRALDQAEGLGNGYDEKVVRVFAKDGSSQRATTYIASHIGESLKPYSWYVNHVLIGAVEIALPEDYVREKIKVIETIEDKDSSRDKQQRSIHNL